MKEHIKNAVITTAMVLATLYVAKRLPVIGPLVAQAQS